VSHRCGIGLQAAREKLRVARRLGELPLVREAFAAGELSYSKVRALCRVAREETEPALLEMARYATTAQLEEIVRTYRAVTGPEELRDHNDRHENRFARWHWDDDGSLVISARLSPEDGAVVLAALEAGRDALESRAEASEGEEHGAGAGAGVADSVRDAAASFPPAGAGSAHTGDAAASLLAEAKSADALVATARLALSAPAGANPPPPEIVIVDRVVLTGGTRRGALLSRRADGRPAGDRPAPGV
jgi:hypothetical protein